MLASIPSSIPNFLDNSSAATELRSAYVQHVICSIVHRRIFQPFLFSLQQDHRKADALFCKMSSEMRQKSIKKEATWRQHTLHAAYTASDAKITTNAIAGDVVDEIVGQIESFIEPSQLEFIKIAVRRIVKVAAETWRYARLEREMITSFMGSTSGNDLKKEQTSTVLLHLMPTVSREPRHVPAKAGEKPVEAVVFLQGETLYSDSPIILARLQELRPTSPTKTEKAPDSRPSTPSSPFLPSIIDSHADNQSSSSYPSVYGDPLESGPRGAIAISAAEERPVTSRHEEKADLNETIPDQTTRRANCERSKSRPISLMSTSQPYDLPRPARSASKRQSVLPTNKSPPSDMSFPELDWGAEDHNRDLDELKKTSSNTTSRGSRRSSRLISDPIPQEGPVEVADSW
jgi:hypothetical protein